MSGGGRHRLAVLASHAIQYQAPLFRALARHPEVDLQVFFCRRRGLDPYRDTGFEAAFAWDIPLLDGYPYSFLRNLSVRESSSGFFGAVNPGIIKAIRADRMDALLIHGWALATYWLAWLGGASRRVPLLLRCEANGLGESGGLRGGLRRAALRAFFPPISAFLAIGTRNADFYRSHGVCERRIFSTPYAVDNERFGAAIQALGGRREELRERYNIVPHLPVVLFCGKLTERKRPLDVLEAMRRLSIDASLVFVGGGPLQGEVEARARRAGFERVRFLGFRNQSELPACYALADLLVVPSAFEPWGLVVNEAMACRLPVVTSDQVGAAPDLVREGVNGFTYPVGDVDALARRVETVLADPVKRDAMGAASLALISEWSIPEAVAGIVDALRASSKQAA